MFMNLTKMMMIKTMIMSTIMVISSNNFLFSWMSMEINLISFIPILKKSKKMKDQMMKFLIIQSLSSSMMLSSMLINSIIESPVNESIILMSSMMLKMGMIPFHIWMPSISMNMSWESCFWLFTIQKISPVTMMTQMISLKIMLPPVILSLIIAPIMAIKQLSLKKILAFSSIANTPWMIMSLNQSTKQFFIFMFIYSMMNWKIMETFKKLNLMFINQTKMIDKSKKKMILLLMLSMAGMPPTIGFLPKWIVIQSAMETSVTISTSMIFSAMISTFMYFKIVSFNLMESTTVKKTTKMNNKNELFLIINLIGLPSMMILKSF